ncbi:MAG: hypothetical protein ACLQJL_02045 [Roseiarcus sp.]
MTLLWREPAQGRANFPFVFSRQKFGNPNFSKAFPGRNVENQKLRAEKIWIRDFF